MLRSDPSPFTILQFQNDKNNPVLTQLLAELPGLKRLVEHLLQKLTDPAEALGRTYQYELIERGTFEIPSVHHDGMSRATGSAIVNSNINNKGTAVFYSFADDPDLILGAFYLALGFPLSVIILPSRKLVINIGDPLWGIQADHLRLLYELKGSEPDFGDLNLRIPKIVMHDSGFAHHLWNQLGALENLVSFKKNKSKIEFLLTHQPLGSLKEIFPEAENWSEELCPIAEFDRKSSQNEIFVPLGSFLIPSQLRERIQDYALKKVTKKNEASVKKNRDAPPSFLDEHPHGQSNTD